MNRREFLGALGGAALAGPIGAVAQQPAGASLIGVLMGSSPSNEATKLDAFREALEKLGYIDGQTILIEVRYAMSQPDQFGSLARELVALAPSVIACVGRRETAALQAATRTIPIVFMQVNDPVEQGFVATLARPGGNTTGFTQMSAELDPKRLELLHEIFGQPKPHAGSPGTVRRRRGGGQESGYRPTTRRRRHPGRSARRLCGD
jgi:putative tryptophan/tyrosine transport system substrate-binding protein